MTHQTHPPHGAGKSSFDLIDPEKLFPALALKPGDAVLDIGCGEGNYTLPLARQVGDTGMVYAVDLWQEGLAALQDKAGEEGVANLQTLWADISQPLALPSASVDLCLMATVLHDLAEVDQDQGALVEIARLVKPGGRLAVVEFKKMEGPPGPPLHIRLAPEEVAALVHPYNFRPGDTRELSPNLYLMIFTRTASGSP